MLDKSHKNEISEETMLIFEYVTNRIETHGLAVTDNSIILDVAVKEYECIDDFWKDFQNYVMSTTGKWVPVSREVIFRSINCECHVGFKTSTLARFYKMFKKFFSPIKNTIWNPQAQ